MFKIYDVAEASKSILRREAALEAQVPQAVKSGIRRVFGQDLRADEAVAKLLADVVIAFPVETLFGPACRLQTTEPRMKKWLVWRASE